MMICFKQKTAYDMGISDWSSDVCSSDLALFDVDNHAMPYWLMNFEEHCEVFVTSEGRERQGDCDVLAKCLLQARQKSRVAEGMSKITVDSPIPYLLSDLLNILRSDEHTSELQSLMRISYAVFCLKTQNTNKAHKTT